ncbi:ABC transporter ATP-binding protein [Mariniplasma anaerobium]|uniref:ABC transporter ATP-binding protein n=1 Tax=Mariniplasma anaerobium TaxID=2735436 RepID=A0A7U9TIS0_9MOLU|nr:ABC transporter ATP-binding protein [Mariniplasma anaerobium]BCR35470.1 hypothetical protein MPAN_003630 [Mariniplasma anaerobium]
MKNKEAIKWLKINHKYLKYPLIGLSLISLILSLLAIFFAYYSKDVINAALDDNRSRFIFFAILISSLLLLNLILTALNNYLTAYYKGIVSKKLKNKYFSQLLKTKQKDINKEHSGVLLTYLDSDIDIISLQVVDIIPRLIFYVARFVGAFILLFAIDEAFALIFLALGLCLIIGSRLITKLIKHRHHQLQISLADSRSFMQESIENIEVIKSFQAEENISQKNEVKQKHLFKTRLRKEKVSIFTSTGLSLFFSFGYAFSIIFGAYQLQFGLSVGALLAMIQLVQHIQSPFNGLSKMIPRYSELIASTERLMILDQYEIEESYKPIEETFDYIDIKHLSFSYDKDIIIKDLNLKINHDDYIHILGPSGKGKSTLFKLLLNLLDIKDGEIKLTTNQNTYQVSNQTRSLMSYVPQNFLILSGTIRDNLNLFKVYTDEQIYEALEIAEIKSFVQALPLKLDTFLKEKGAGLSIGQIQRLAIARALLKDAPILLLDEITSALDQDTETIILKNIKALTKKTVIISSHRRIESDIITKTVEL